MDSILTIMEFAKKLFSSQLLVMQDSSLIAIRDVLHAQLVANHAPVLLSVPLVLKTVSKSLMVSVKPNVEMESLLELNNVTIETSFQTMAVHQHVKSKLFGLVLVNHLPVLTMVQQYAETEESKEEKNVMMETWLTETDVQADVKRKLPQLLQLPQLLTVHQPAKV